MWLSRNAYSSSKGEAREVVDVLTITKSLASDWPDRISVSARLLKHFRPL